MDVIFGNHLCNQLGLEEVLTPSFHSSVMLPMKRQVKGQSLTPFSINPFLPQYRTHPYYREMQAEYTQRHKKNSAGSKEPETHSPLIEDNTKTETGHHHLYLPRQLTRC